MLVRNIHTRVLGASPARVGQLVDSLASPADALWPRDHWPAMRFDCSLQVGVRGGHGPIRYTVAVYQPGKYIEFRFDTPRGFDGYHAFFVEPLAADQTRLWHLLVMHTTGPARLSWPLVFRPLHDALIEDCLDTAARAVAGQPGDRAWSPWVVALRGAVRAQLSLRLRHATRTAVA
jgi:hypothetical protein